MAYGHFASKLAGAVALGAMLAGSGVMAQEKKPAAPAPAAKPAAPAAKDAAAGGGSQSAWVKLCEKAQIPGKDKDGKESVSEKSICLTHHERLDGNTGMVLVSAAIREVEGQAKPHLMVMVPLGMVIPPGVRAIVLSKEQWAKTAQNEKIDEAQLKALKPIELKYSLCHPAGCTAETEATPEIIESMKTGGGMMVQAVNAGMQAIAFPVPLDGFGAAHTGAPVDNKAYGEARAKLMEQIRDRQKQIVEQYRKEQEEKAKGGGAAPAPAAAAPAAEPKKK